MTRIPFPLPDVALVALQRHEDARGVFWETWREAWREDLGVQHAFVQDNVSVSRRGVLRGLHFQDPVPQGKGVVVLSGEIYDVVVDLRPESPTFARWASAVLAPGTALFIPRGFAHGFFVQSEEAVVAYKVDAPYTPEAEHTLAWDDPDLAIPWPLEAGERPVLSPRDRVGRRLLDLAR